jgi:sugar-specific transcriptional regulator TrmB
LEKLGFSNYEARAYLALLQEGPATGYQLSKSSGVPRSRVYETLERLTHKGLVLTLQADPALYAPVDSHEVLARLRTEFDDSLKSLEDEIANLSARATLESIWTIQGRDNILAKARVMIKEAKESVYLAAWDYVIQRMQAELEEASARGIRVIVVSCGELNLAVGTLYRHHFQEQLCPEDDSSIDLVIDGREILVGEALLGDAGQAAWTRNAGLVMVAEEYIRHEVYIQKLIERLGPGVLDQVQAAFVEGLAEIPHRSSSGG